MIAAQVDLEAALYAALTITAGNRCRAHVGLSETALSPAAKNPRIAPAKALNRDGGIDVAAAGPGPHQAQPAGVFS